MMWRRKRILPLEGNKIKEPKSDLVLRGFAYFFSICWLIALLFPLYWLVLTSVKDQAAAYKMPPDLIPTIPYEYTLVIDSTAYPEYTYDDFKTESTLIVWYEFDNNPNINMGKLTVQWVSEGRLKATTSLSQRTFKAMRNVIFSATSLNAYLIMRDTNMSACQEVIEDDDGFSVCDKSYRAADASDQSNRLGTESNSIVLTDRDGSNPRSPFVFENPVSATSQKLSFSSLFNNYVAAFKYFKEDGVGFQQFLMNSAVISFGAVFLQWLLIAAAAYGLSRLVAKKIANILMTLFIATMMIPNIVYIVPLYSMIQRFSLKDNFLSVILPGVPNAIALVLFKGFFDDLPKELVEAARIDGASEYSIYFRMIIPLSYSVFGIITILVFTGNWNDIMWPTMVLSDTKVQTFSVVINRMMGNIVNGSLDYPLVLAMSAIAALPTFILFAFFQKQMTKGLVFSGVKG